jgi:hypothetical protein
MSLKAETKARHSKYRISSGTVEYPSCSEMPGFYEGGTDELDIRLKMARYWAICDVTMKTIEFSFSEKTYGSEHRLVGNSDHAFEGQIHLQNEENGARDREC